ncbi:MAG: hypothetical protein Kow0069_25880 [Promethearchaeota archaeon]
MDLIAYCDGGSRGNPGPAAVGVVLVNAAGRVVSTRGEFIGVHTNNQAEYVALLRALELAAALGAKRVACYSDSQLLVKQLRGEYAVRNPGLRRLHDGVRRKEAAFEEVTYERVGREHPLVRLADRLLNEALDARS